MGMLEGLTSLAGNVIGGWFQREANEDNRAGQEAFAKSGIQWRVEDAKKAGLHPLYALSGGGASFTPSAQPLMTGQDLSQTARAFMAKDDREIADATKAEILSRTRLNEVQAQAVASQQARDELRDLATYGLGGSKSHKLPGPPGRVSGLPGLESQTSPKAFARGGPDQAIVKPMETPSPSSVDASRTGGPSFPWFTPYRVDKDFSIDLPYSQEGPSEARESISLYDWPSIIGHNMRVYGEGWLNRFLRYTMGMDPNKTLRFLPESERAKRRAASRPWASSSQGPR